MERGIKKSGPKVKMFNKRGDMTQYAKGGE